MFRRPTPRECDPEYDDCRPADSWVLIDQWGGYDQADHAQQLAAAHALYGQPSTAHAA